ncbi:MAG: transcriptional regulator [Clostridia bacterium]|jgi:hypothetical protein|nr:transcriptional regulator [Clostridia bacterium]
MPKRTFFRLDEDKKERIIRAAIDEFHKNGFENAKIGNIADEAQIAKGSIYQYFEDKKELFMYSINWSLDYFMKNIDYSSPVEEMDPFDYLLSDGHKKLELLKKEKVMVYFFKDIMTGKFGAMTKEINDYLWKIGDEHLLKLIDVGIKKGTIRSDVDKNLLLLFYKGVTMQMDEYVFLKAEEDVFDLSDEKFTQIENYIKNIVELMKHGMGC